MIDVSRVRYDLVAITPQGQRLHLQEVIRDLTWEEHPEELAVRLRAEIQNQRMGSGWLHQLLPLGGHVLLYANWGEGWREMFRGMIFATDYSTDPLGHFVITAYDMLYQLQRSKDDRYYKAGTTAATIIRDIAGAWRIPIGTIEGPNIALGKQVFRSMSVAEMIREALEQARKRGAGRFLVQAKEGKIHVVKAGKNTTIYRFGADIVTSINDQQNIEDLVTRVKIVGSESKDERRPVVATLDGRTEFGILQELVYKSKSDQPSAALEEARQILAERGKPKRVRRVEAPDVPFLRRGDKIYVEAGTLKGYYLISGITHSATNRTMTMEVEDVA